MQCTSLGNLEREAQNLKAEAAGERPKSEEMLNAMEKDGTRAKPEYGSMWCAVAGPDREHARPESHITIAVPGATSQSTGLPDNGRGGGAWIVNAGTMKAHIMVRGTDNAGVGAGASCPPALSCPPASLPPFRPIGGIIAVMKKKSVRHRSSPHLWRSRGAVGSTHAQQGTLSAADKTAADRHRKPSCSRSPSSSAR